MGVVCAGSVGCNADQSERLETIDATAHAITFNDEVRSRWVSGAKLEAVENGFQPHAPKAGNVSVGLHARFPNRADGETELRVGATRVSVKLRGANASEGRLRDGRVHYDHVLSSGVSRTVVGSDVFAEEFLTVPNRAAGSDFEWVFGGDVTSARAEAEGSATLHNSEGEAILRVSKPLIIDASGTTREGRLSWEASARTLHVQFDPEGLVYPVVVDPTFEVAVWTQPKETPAIIGIGGISYDEAHGNLIFVSADNTEVYRNGIWSKVVAYAPPLGGTHVFFPPLHKTVLAGAADRSTWLWDGATWAALPIDSPPFRENFRIAYDRMRQRIVLFGGNIGLIDQNETWEFDGKSWSRISTATVPAARMDFGMVYDEVRQRTILFGGRTHGNNSFGDTWAYDGTNWQMLSASGPNARSGVAMVYDAEHQNIVMNGGGTVDGNGYFNTFSNETWVLDAAGWSQRVPATSPPGRVSASMIYDRARKKVVLCGGANTPGIFVTALTDMWEWDGTTWAPTTGMSAPSFTWSGQAWAYDPIGKGILSFGGYGSSLAITNDTWFFERTHPTKKAPATSPPARRFAQMIWDQKRNEMLLFGGDNGTNALSDTWTWNGTTWTKKTPAHSPPPVTNAALAYDAKREKVVLFGGSANPGYSPLSVATWSWDGTDWTNLAPAHSPSTRFGTAMVYDAAHEQIVLFGGGVTNGAAFDDTWVWDGTDWAQKNPTQKPSARIFHAMTYDSKRNVTLLWGGGAGRDTWLWDGDNWQLLAVTGPSTRWLPGFAYDESRGESVLVGGNILINLVFGDSWILRLRGGSCVADSDCSQSYCVDGVCCDVSSCGVCEACNVAGAEGTCAAVRAKQDPDSCGGANACDANGTCKKHLGGACADAADCASGFCIDGVCCDTLCDGLCAACRGDLKVDGVSGTCGFAKEGSDTRDDCLADEPTTCQRDGTCDGAGRCKKYAKGTSCGADVCSGNRAVARVCDGIGGCGEAAVGIDCAPYVCDLSKGACTDSCARDVDCTGFATCDVEANKCVGADPSTQIKCDGDHTLLLPDGTKADCGAYKCSGAVCKETCSVVEDCIGGLVCSFDGRCISPSEVIATNEAGGGCSTSPASSTYRSMPFLAVAVALACTRRRRRMRASRIVRR